MNGTEQRRRLRTKDEGALATVLALFPREFCLDPHGGCGPLFCGILDLLEGDFSRHVRLDHPRIERKFASYGVDKRFFGALWNTWIMRSAKSQTALVGQYQKMAKLVPFRAVTALPLSTAAIND